MYKIDTETLEKIVRTLEAVASQDISASLGNLDDAHELAEYIKNNYTQIK
jgi:hypothetical protein